MKELRAKRQQAIDNGDNAALKVIRRELHHLNHRLRVAARQPTT